MKTTSPEFYFLKVLSLAPTTKRSFWHEILLAGGTALIDGISACARNAIHNETLAYRATWLSKAWFKRLAADKDVSADTKAHLVLQHRAQVKHLIQLCLEYIEKQK